MTVQNGTYFGDPVTTGFAKPCSLTLWLARGAPSPEQAYLTIHI